MVTVFEKAICQKINDACATVRDTVKKDKQLRNRSFYGSVEKFVKKWEDIGTLGGVEALLPSEMSQEMRDDFREIVGYRNYVAHGKRSLGKGTVTATKLTIKEVGQALDKVLSWF
jgi:hypothetical protein